MPNRRSAPRTEVQGSGGHTAGPGGQPFALDSLDPTGRRTGGRHGRVGIRARLVSVEKGSSQRAVAPLVTVKNAMPGTKEKMASMPNTRQSLATCFPTG